jgi:hypothetical protein
MLKHYRETFFHGIATRYAMLEVMADACHIGHAWGGNRVEEIMCAIEKRTEYLDNDQKTWCRNILVRCQLALDEDWGKLMNVGADGRHLMDSHREQFGNSLGLIAALLDDTAS